MPEKVKKKNNGKKFENYLKSSCENTPFWCERFADSNKFGMNSMTRFTTNSPADFLLFDHSTGLFYLELKSTEGNSLSVETEAPIKPPRRKKGEPKPEYKPKKTYMIKYHQLEGLTIRNSYDKMYGVVLFHFITSDSYYWMFASDIIPLTLKLDKKSINEKDIKENGKTIDTLRIGKKVFLDIEKLVIDISLSKNYVQKGD